ncbi:sulfatase-like hydrolase/transferase (plasmid) [Verrucomicrobiaceae bacterium 227]
MPKFANLLSLGLAVTFCQLQAGEVEERPNIILCMTDDQGWGDVGYNGHPILRTPHLDQMSREGLRFDRFYASSPVCSPTRGSCLTGRHPYRYGIPFANTGHMKAEEITLAEILKDKGYTTGHFGKWHLGTLTTKTKDANRGKIGSTENYSPPWKHGFDVCFSTESKVPTYWKPGSYETYGTHYWTGTETMVPAGEIQGDDSVLVMNQALPFIRKAAEKKTPFFTVIWFHAPHLPVVSAPPFTDGYTENKDYYGCITALDSQMGRLRAELKSLNVAENTMIWFCSDNGPEGNSKDPGSAKNLRGRKRSLYEGGVRVPGLLIWPKMISENRTITMPCSTSDYFPTVMEALGHTLPEKLARPYDGVSLIPLIKGEMKERPRPIAFESRGQVSLSDNRWKLISDTKGKNYQLYDIVTDPGEAKNLAAKNPKIVSAMKAQLKAWRESCKKSAAGKDYN